MQGAASFVVAPWCRATFTWRVNTDHKQSALLWCEGTPTHMPMPMPMPMPIPCACTIAHNAHARMLNKHFPAERRNQSVSAYLKKRVPGTHGCEARPYPPPSHNHHLGCLGGKIATRPTRERADRRTGTSRPSAARAGCHVSKIQLPNLVTRIGPAPRPLSRHTTTNNPYLQDERSATQSDPST